MYPGTELELGLKLLDLCGIYAETEPRPSFAIQTG